MISLYKKLEKLHGAYPTSESKEFQLFGRTKRMGHMTPNKIMILGHCKKAVLTSEFCFKRKLYNPSSSRKWIDTKKLNQRFEKMIAQEIYKRFKIKCSFRNNSEAQHFPYVLFRWSNTNVQIEILVFVEHIVFDSETIGYSAYISEYYYGIYSKVPRNTYANEVFKTYKPRKYLRTIGPLVIPHFTNGFDLELRSAVVHASGRHHRSKFYQE